MANPKPIRAKIKILRDKGEVVRDIINMKPAEENSKKEEKKDKIKKGSIDITPSAEIVARKTVGPVTGVLVKPLSSKEAFADVEGSYKGLTLGGRYSTGDKRLAFRGSYVSPKGVSVSADTESKNVNVDIPTKKGSVGASLSPEGVGGRYSSGRKTASFEYGKYRKGGSIGYETKKGNLITAEYEKGGPVKVGAIIKINKKKKK